MSIVMTGGGTGGHLAIVRAVKEELTPAEGMQDTEKPVYIGSTRGQDRAWFEGDDDFSATYFLESRGVVNQRGLGKFASLWQLARSVREARRLLKQHRARVVFSVGGYSAAPAAIAALTLRIPLVIHEQNAAVGSLNRLLRPFAHTFLSSYDEASPIKSYPVKSVFFDKARIRKEVKTVLFLGGSQGAKAINELALTLAPSLHERGIAIVHQAGERHLDTVAEAYAKFGIEAEVFGFTDMMPDMMERADFAIARAGASTLWELAANALPALFIPYPYAAGDHQYHNARFLLQNDAAWVMREEEFDPNAVLELLDTSMYQKSEALMKLAKRDGAVQIAKLLRSFE